MATILSVQLRAVICRSYLSLLTLFALLGGSAVGASGQEAVDPRILQVESGLLPITIAKNEKGKLVDILQRMKAFGVPGLSVAVIDGDQLVWAKGYGVADVGSGGAVTPDTLFQAASISKPLAALGVLALVQDGKLRLDDDANLYLKNWKIPDNKFTQSHKVTLRLLLNHSAGVADVEFPPYEPQQPIPTLLQVLNGEPPATNKPITIASIPGDAYSYSRAGYDILQQLVTDVSGESFERYMQSKILEPLGMMHSSFQQPLPAPLSRLAAAAHYAGGEPVPGELRGSEMAMAGLWSTPSDLARYLVNVQQSYKGASESPIGPALAREMLAPAKGNRGLGPVISGEGSTARFGHDGFNEGFESSIVGYVQRGQGAVVMANSGFSFMLIKEVLDSIARAYQWPQYDSTNQRPLDASMAPQAVSLIPMDLIAASVGKYHLDEGHTVQLVAKGKHLFIQWPGAGVAEVFATQDGRWFCPQLIFADFGSPWLQFVRTDDAGKTVSKIVIGGDGGAEFSRSN